MRRQRRRKNIPAQALLQAGPCAAAVRFQGTIHDFVMLNALPRPGSRVILDAEEMSGTI